MIWIKNDALPETVTVGGREYRIDTDFRTWAAFETVMLDGKASEDHKITSAIRMIYTDRIPADVEGALSAMLDFYRCGRKQTEREGAQTRSSTRAYSFLQDEGLIYAAFLSTYDIDLAKARMHWWSFRALMEALPEDCAFSRVMRYRTADTKDMSKAEKKHYEKMRKVYAIKTSDDKPHMTLAERDAAMRARLAQAYERAYERERAAKDGG